jgi:hypothetical protein
MEHEDRTVTVAWPEPTPEPWSPPTLASQHERRRALDDYLRREREREYVESGGRMPWAA